MFESVVVEALGAGQVDGSSPFRAPAQGKPDGTAWRTKGEDFKVWGRDGWNAIAYLRRNGVDAGADGQGWCGVENPPEVLYRWGLTPAEIKAICLQIIDATPEAFRDGVDNVLASQLEACNAEYFFDVEYIEAQVRAASPGLFSDEWTPAIRRYARILYCHPWSTFFPVEIDHDFAEYVLGFKTRTDLALMRDAFIKAGILTREGKGQSTRWKSTTTSAGSGTSPSSASRSTRFANGAGKPSKTASTRSTGSAPRRSGRRTRRGGRRSETRCRSSLRYPLRDDPVRGDSRTSGSGFVEIKKRRHHFVQKKFLEPWLVDGRVWTLLNRSRIEAMDPINVAVMRDFHSVGVYTEADINLLGSIAVTGTTGPRREQVTEMVDIVAHPSRKYRRMLDEHPEDPEAAEVYLHNAYEEFHSRVETSGEPFLAALRAGDLSFLKDFDSYLKFMFFLAVQSMRTRTNRARFSKQFHTINQRGDADCDRVWLGLAFVGGDKVAWNLAERHRDIRIELLHVKGSSHLVTADHPVVNLDHSFPEVPTKFRWYYPLTPTLAFLLTSDHPKGGTGHVGISDGRVAELNRKMANESLLQVFADSEAALMPLRVAAEARPRNQ